MLHQEFEPPKALQNTIKCFWYDKRDFGNQQTSFRVLPDGYAEIIFQFGETCSIASADGLQPVSSPFLMGLLNQPVFFHTRGAFQIIGVRCYPWTVFDLLGLPPGEGSVNVLQHPIAHLQSTLNQFIQACEPQQAITHLTQYFLEARRHITANSMLHKAGTAMAAANGAIPVSKVALAAHTTIRTLERTFKHSSGRTVKDVSGLMRFEQARNRLWHYPDTGLAGLAQELGYADQSHLSREFKRYTGIPPAAFAKNAKKAAGNDFVAFVQA